MSAMSRQMRRYVAPLFMLALLPGFAGASAFERLFAPKAELWARWTQHQANDQRTIAHDTWHAFLQRYVARDDAGLNRVAYARVSSADRDRLNQYISDLAATPISNYSRDEQFPYWVNLYNALTVQVILDQYPVDSIRDIDISPGLFADGPWRKKLVSVEGEMLSLDDIEHRILRPIWNDPRIHYAVNCAAVGCPNLQGAAFTATNTEAMLDQAARDYVNNPRGVRVDGGRATFSSIYNWFAADFDVDGGVLEHIKRYAQPALLADLDGVERIDDYAYDWSLNAGIDQQ